MRKNNNLIPCIPLEKAWVRGYYERRNGKLVWVKPYENSKSRKPDDGGSDVRNLVETTEMPLKQPPPSSSEHAEVKPLGVAQIDKESMNWLLSVIIKCVKTIKGFEEGEIVRLYPALSIARSIIKELGYYDKTMDGYFTSPQVKASKLSSGAARETQAMAKNLKQLTRRVTKSTLREKVQRMSSQLEEAL